MEGAINLQPVTHETRQTPFGPITTGPGLLYIVLYPLLKKIADATDDQFQGKRTSYCNPLPLVPFAIPQETPFGNIPLRPQMDPDLMAAVVAIHAIADGLDRGWGAPKSILGSPVVEGPPEAPKITPTLLAPALAQKMVDLTGPGPFVVFSHPNPLYQGGGHDPILDFPELPLYAVSGGDSGAADYDDLKAVVDQVLASGGIVVGVGHAADYHIDSAYHIPVPNGYHCVAPSTEHPGDGSRSWQASDFVQLVAD